MNLKSVLNRVRAGHTCVASLKLIEDAKASGVSLDVPVVYLDEILDSRLKWNYARPYGEQLDRMRQTLLERDELGKILDQVRGALIVCRWSMQHAQTLAYWVKHGFTVESLAELPFDWEINYHRTSPTGLEQTKWLASRRSVKKPSPQKGSVPRVVYGLRRSNA